MCSSTTGAVLVMVATHSRSPLQRQRQRQRQARGAGAGLAAAAPRLWARTLIAHIMHEKWEQLGRLVKTEPHWLCGVQPTNMCADVMVPAACAYRVPLAITLNPLARPLGTREGLRTGTRASRPPGASRTLAIGTLRSAQRAG